MPRALRSVQCRNSSSGDHTRDGYSSEAISRIDRFVGSPVLRATWWRSLALRRPALAGLLRGFTSYGVLNRVFAAYRIAGLGDIIRPEPIRAVPPDFCPLLVEFVAATRYDALALNSSTLRKGANMTAAIRQFTVATILVTCGTVARAAETYTVDPVHSSISFMISHAGISNIHGRFNDFSGKITIDQADPAKSSFALSIPVESIDTNNVKRDEHLRAPDYFNVKQFPTMSFQSTKVKAVDGGYEVTGDLTLHGITKPVSFKLKGGDKVVEFPKGTKRIGLVSTLSIVRSDFGVTAEIGALGDEIPISIGIEAAK